MKSREIAFMGLMLAMGFILHTIIPGFFFGMKPDMQQVMLFLSITLFYRRDQVTVMAIGTALLCALTTSFPGGQIPNIVDKLITATVFFSVFKMFIYGKESTIKVAALTFGCTLISGAIFLTAASLMVGLPASFSVLYLVVVLPAATVNCMMMVIIYPLTKRLKTSTKVAI